MTMKLTNYQHACFSLENEGKLLIVDPGEFTQDLGYPENVVAVVVTHNHGDHFDPAALGAIIAHNPDAVIIGHESITRQLGDTLPTMAVISGQTVRSGPFELKFGGGDHAIIHDSFPHVDNLTVHINDTVFYPGDSFDQPVDHVKVLALPVAAPWMKLSEAMDYITSVKPDMAFPTHDEILSAAGKGMVDHMISDVAKDIGARYQRITAPIEI